MKTFLKVILLLFWYALVGTGSFALIVYGLNIEVEWIPVEKSYFLYGGIGLLLLSLIIAIVLLATPRSTHKKEKDVTSSPVQPSSETELQETKTQEAENETIVSDTENDDTDKRDQTSSVEVTASETETPENNEDLKQVEPETEQTNSPLIEETPNEEDNNDKSEGMTFDDLPSLDTEEENSENEPADDFIENVTETKTTSTEIENKTSEALATPVAQTSSPVEPVVKMTETQQQFIRDSKNSYLNTEGLPQFKITKQIDSKAIVAQENKRLDELEKSSAGKPSKLPVAVKVFIIVFSIAAGLVVAWLIYTYLIK